MTNPFINITTLEILAFIIPFVIAILVDIFAHKSHKPISFKNAAVWSAIWMGCLGLFGIFIYHVRGVEAMSLYYTGALLEKGLAIDNLFAFYLIFKSFGLTTKENQHFQHSILYWGIFGAIFFRVIFLSIGAYIVNFSPYVLIFFAFLVLWTVWKMWTAQDEDEVDYTKHWSVNFLNKFTKANPSIESGKFFHKGITPLFSCLFCIEMCDLVFAGDSVPTILAVVSDPYLMITSSLWAAAGLRSLYFLLVAAQDKFWALDKAVMILLILVAAKLISNGLGYHLSNTISLIVVITVLVSGILYSLFVKEKHIA